MNSQNARQPDFAARVLNTTLASVRQRRFRRNATIAGFAALLISSAWLVRSQMDSTPQVHSPPLVGRPANDADPLQPTPESENLIQYVHANPLNLIVRIPESENPPLSTLIKRVSHEPGVLSRYPSLTNQQLLASLPPDHPAGLVRQSDGSYRLIRID